jgi:hypothetical protein
LIEKYICVTDEFMVMDRSTRTATEYCKLIVYCTGVTDESMVMYFCAGTVTKYGMFIVYSTGVEVKLY